MHFPKDALPDEKSGQLSRDDVYDARIALNPAGVSMIKGFRPTPAMLEEVL